MLAWRNIFLSLSLLLVTAVIAFGSIMLAAKETEKQAEHEQRLMASSGTVNNAGSFQILADRPVQAKKHAFIRRLLPAIMAENARIQRERERLEILVSFLARGGTLSIADERWLNELAQKYRTEPHDLDGLLRRVDIIPPSLALAQSAEESGWGRSRFAREGNAYFGQHTWTPVNGMAPRGSGADPDYYIRRFDSLSHSVASYMNNLNSHPAYRKFRAERARMRGEGLQLNGQKLAATLLRYSERGEAYIENLNMIMRANALTRFDRVDIATAAEFNGSTAAAY